MRFVLIDRITMLDPGRRAAGYKQIALDEPYFEDHFPGYPLVPGVLVLESLAQLGGRLVEASARQPSGRRVLPLLGKVDQTRFLRAVRPGERLDLEVEMLACTDDAARVQGTARVGDRRAAVATMMYALLAVDEHGSVLDRPQTEALLSWSDRIWRQLTDPADDAGVRR